jgi:hypothetical protein
VSDLVDSVRAAPAAAKEVACSPDHFALSKAAQAVNIAARAMMIVVTSSTRAGIRESLGAAASFIVAGG